MKPRCQVLATQQLPADSRGGDDDWLGGRIMPCSRCLTARSDCQTQQDSDNGDKPGKCKGSVLKLEVPLYFSLILIKGKNVSVTCSYAPEKRFYPRLPQATQIL